MYRLNYKKRVWIVKKHLEGMPTNWIAESQKISCRTVQKLRRTFDEFGWEALKDHKNGRPEVRINRKAEILILNIRREYGYGACHIEQILKKRGFAISHRQIEKLLLRNGLVEPNVRKQKSRKWVRYELPRPNDLWHTDWSYDPFTQLQLSVYIDDRTRLITSHGLFKRATTENTLALLKVGIAHFGKPKSIMTDHGSQYYANKADSKNQHTRFRIALDSLGIRHYLARVNRPQTNGKVERFFLSYKKEFTTGAFKSLHEYIRHYNESRLHMSLYYKTPKEVWDELVNAN